MAEMNGHPAMQVMADFYFTNISNRVLLTGTFLVAYFWTFGLIPRRRRVTTGHVLVRAPNSQLHGVYPVGPGGNDARPRRLVHHPASAEAGATASRKSWLRRPVRQRVRDQGDNVEQRAMTTEQQSKLRAMLMRLGAEDLAMEVAAVFVPTF